MTVFCLAKCTDCSMCQPICSTCDSRKVSVAKVLTK